jgi:hypothetical protein
MMPKPKGLNHIRALVDGSSGAVGIHRFLSSAAMATRYLINIEALIAKCTQRV